MAVERRDYELVAAGQTDQILGPVGNLGDIIERLIISVVDDLASAVSIKDGNGAAIPILGAGVLEAVYSIEMGVRCKNPITPGWKVTTDAGVSLMAIGRFS